MGNSTGKGEIISARRVLAKRLKVSNIIYHVAILKGDPPLFLVLLCYSAAMVYCTYVQSTLCIGHFVV